MNPLATSQTVPAPTAAWAFNEPLLLNALARVGDLMLTEAVLDFLHSGHAQKLRINEGRQTGGLIAPRHRRAVDLDTIIFGGCAFKSPLLMPFEGATVLVDFDSTSADRIHVYSLSGEFIADAHRERIGGAG